MISSPYARRGVLWDLYSRHYGPQGDPAILVAVGASRVFNPTLKEAVVTRAMERDAASAQAEYLAQFRTDLESFVNAEAVQACVVPALYERAPVRGVQYMAFTDPSGGSADSFTLAIGHVDHSRNRLVVIDAIREAIPGRSGSFSPASICAEFSQLLHSYRVGVVYGDKYAGVWPVEQFSRFNIKYEQSAKPKSDLYVDLLPLLNSGQVHLLDHPKTVNQLCSLERRTARSGRDSIDHPPNAHDDLANAVAGLASILTNLPTINYQAWSDNSESDPDGVESWRRLARNVYLQSHGTMRFGPFGYG
jgi:hypothetical protein